ncbi:Mlo2-like protein [Elsinoe fawcettii]|nr:Mlo2-like protein [Elsinoe fawcettii]
MSDELAVKPTDSGSQISAADSQTAQEYIAQQLQLEAEAKEALPYQFDSCTKPLGALRQSLFSCLTCNPPPQSVNDPYNAAGICYSCSISCHGEHELVELFSKRDFECDCGTTRTPASAPCNLRSDPQTGAKGNMTGELARPCNKYNHNFAGRFCGCGDEYDPHKEKGTMFQCLGLGNLEEGGCGEDWWHPECIMGLSRHKDGGLSSMKTKAPPLPSVTEEAEVQEQTRGTLYKDDDPPLPFGFPAEDDFEHMICYKCIDSNPWLKQYAATEGFLPPVHFFGRDAPQVKAPILPGQSQPTPAKRKMEDGEEEPEAKRSKSDPQDADPASNTTVDAATIPSDLAQAYHVSLPPATDKRFSLFLKEDFRDNFCRCRECFPRLAKFPHLLEEEDTYEPPVSESDEGDGQGSVGSRSLLDRGEAALSNMDRARAIEGVMAYNHLKTNLKSFLQPFADSGQAVGAEDIKAYFAKLRGDEAGLSQATTATDGGGDGDNRREQSGY